MKLKKKGNSEMDFAFLLHFICYLVMENGREWNSGQAPSLIWNHALQFTTLFSVHRNVVCIGHCNKDVRLCDILQRRTV